VRAGLLFERLLALPIDDVANSCPIDRARAHRAGLGGGVEGAVGEELEAEARAAREARRRSAWAVRALLESCRPLRSSLPNGCIQRNCADQEAPMK
jgi:hypothetical protein